MRTVGLKILKNKLSEYMRMVASGETVLVTDRDRVVAELRPPHGRGPTMTDALLADAMRRGWLAAPLVAQGGPPSRGPVTTLDTLLQELQKDRDER